MRTLGLAAVLLLSGIAGCGDDGDPPVDEDGGRVDAGGADAGPPDAGPRAGDAGPPLPRLACESGWVTQDLPPPDVEATAALRAHPTAPARVRLASRELVAGAPSEVAALRAALRARPALAFVHASGAPPAIAGVWPVEILGRGFLVAALDDRAALERLLAHPAITTVLAVRPEDKLSRFLARAEPARALPLTVHRVVDGRLSVTTVDARAATALALARDPTVLRVRAGHRPRPLLDVQRRAVGTDAVHALDVTDGVPVYGGPTGHGVVIGVVDTGVDPDHPDFALRDGSGEVVGTRVSGDGPVDGESHGTIVAGIAAGDGWASEGRTHEGTLGTPFLWRGHAPGVERIVSVAYAEDPVREVWLRAHLDDGAHVSNHSYTQSTGFYMWRVANFDAFIRDGASEGERSTPGRVVVFAAANQGTGPPSFEGIEFQGYYSVMATGKNPICVGGTYANDDMYATNASMGPTLDGRIKPDLVAPGYKDYRPPDGLLLEVDSVTIHAAADSGLEDVVWDFDDPAPDGWTLTGDLEGASVTGGILSAPVLGGGGIQLDPPDPFLSHEGYDRVSVRMRLVVEATGGHRWPRFWTVRWSRRADLRIDGNAYPTFPADVKDDAWHTHEVSLAGHDRWDTAIRRIRVQPVTYDERVIAPTIGDGYGRSGGTSMAAPVVTGVVALMMDHLRWRHGVDFDAAPLAPSTYKALLIHTARDLARDAPVRRDRPNPDTGESVVYPAGPDFTTGWGLVDAERVIRLIEAHRSPGRRFTEQRIADGEVHRYRFAVRDDVSAGPLRVTLAWDDAPGPVMTDDFFPKLVNDLDVVLVDPDGVVYSPWVLDPLPIDQETYLDGIDPIATSDVAPARRCVSDALWAPERAGECEDHLNNVEQVLVDSPASGWWTLLVRGAVPVGPQRYSLVMTQECE